MYKGSLAICEKALGSVHPGLAPSLHNLAVRCRSLFFAAVHAA